MTIETIFKFGSYYGIGGALGDHIIGAKDDDGRQVFVAAEHADEKTCICTGYHHPLAATATNRRKLAAQMKELEGAPSILVTLPGYCRQVRMVFPHRL